MHLTTPFKKGDSLLNFTFKKVIKIEELQCVFYELEHNTSGAHVIHLANEDEENVFCLAFQTLPSDSTGVSHILEHTVLCGSKKYPVKDPFFGMTRRSLNTFMNALTGSDFTCYPAASQVEQDFYNLLDVYLDAVFHPLLNRYSFLQEGCRLEFETPDDPATPLVYKGIVFNEMKGSLSSGDSRLWHLIHRYLMPDLPYAHNSGGDPKEIPHLTYEDFCKFYETFYHPSRCLFYFYGNLPLEKHLNFIEDKILKKVKKPPSLPPIPHQKRFTSPVHKLSSYPTHEKDLSHKTFISFSWLTTEIRNQQDVLALTLLDSILMDTDASPLKLALLQSGLCRQVDALTDIEMSEVPMNIVCKGCNEHDAEKLQAILFKTLKDIADQGLEKKLIDSSLHQLEFSGMEITGDYYPFGLNLFFRSGLAKLHGCPPEQALLIHSQFEKLLNLTQDPAYLPRLIRKYFIDNPHFVRIILKPDPHLAEEETKQEKELLSRIKASLDQKAIDSIIQETHALEDFQEKIEQEELTCLPKISLHDVPKKVKLFKLDVHTHHHTKLYHHECFTNHITYVNFVTSLPSLNETQLLYTKLFILLFAEVGAKDRSYIQNLEMLHAYTGGLGCSLGIHTQCRDPDVIKPAIHLRGKALSRNIPHLFKLMKELLLDVRFDEKARIKELILQIFTDMQNRLSKNALSYAIDLALCNNSNATKLHHNWHGLKFYKFIQDLALHIDERLSTIMQELNALKHILFHHHETDLILSCNAHDKEWIEREGFFGLNAMQKGVYTPWSNHFNIEPTLSHARLTSTPVAFTCMATKTICAPDPLSPFLSLATTIMQNKVLHKKIREQGGAYGAGASYNVINGNFHMYSYRDPHIASTLEAFKEAILTLREGNFTDQDLEEAKFGVIQHMDSPVAPGSRGNDAYIQVRENLRPEFRQSFRDKILEAGADHIKKAVELHLNHFTQESRIVTFCGKDLLTKENALLENKLPILSI
jgi:Zn-dependent M16 (insulinase) family peptidase